MARPKIEIDWDTVDKLCGIFCTGEEIAAVVGCDYKTLERRCKKEKKKGFGEYIREKSLIGNASLRRMQYKNAEKGNAVMQIWLGKQYLEQSDKNTIQGEETKPIVLAYDPNRKLIPRGERHGGSKDTSEDSEKDSSKTA